nr:hypothetical protein [Streptomyces sp. PAN_FS17]
MRRYADRPLRIGSFSAASNVTGILTDTDRVTRLLHANGVLSFWDYAAAAPYVPIRVAESVPGAADHKDALFSPRTSSSAARRPLVSSSSAATRSAAGCPPRRAEGASPSSIRSGTVTSTPLSPARRAAPRP